MSREHEPRREEVESEGPPAVAVGRRSLAASRYPALVQALGDRGSAGEPTIHDAATAAVEHKGAGAAVDTGVASRVGAHLGADFSGVRVHSDPLAQQATSAMGARAFAYGGDVFLGPSESGGDLSLMAHELTHVAQQGAAGQRSLQRQVQVGDADSPAEREADQVAADVTGGQGRPAALLVENGPVAPGQMLKSQFLEQLRTEARAAADAELGPIYAPIGCPHVDQYFDRLAGQSASVAEEQLWRLAPGVRGATIATAMIPIVVARVRDGVRQWRDTGQPPADLAAAGGPATGAAAGASASGAAATNPQAAGAAPKLVEPDSPAGLAAQLGPGEVLDGATASRMEGAFGESFASVRVHTDATAARLSADHDAHAFTIGNHIAFAAGSFQPGTPAGDALIAHELAHVGQQAGAGPVEYAVQRKPVGDDDAAEASADDAARGVLASLYGGARKAVRAMRDTLTTDVSLKRCPRSQPTGSLTPGGSVAHTTGATMDTYVSSSAAIRIYVASAISAGRVATGHVHFYSAADFRTRAIAYLMVRTNPSTGATFTRPEAEAFEPGIEAFRDGADIHVNQERGEPATVLHEAMHLYSSDAYRTQLGFNINEGTTEWLMNIVCGEQSVAVLRPAYVSETRSIGRLEARVGRDPIMRAYFQGNIAGLRTAVDAATSAGTFDTWKGHMQAGRYADADALM